MNKNRLLLLSLLMISLCIKAQKTSYRILEANSFGSSNVSIDLIVYCKKKKDIEFESKLAAVKTVLFNGIGIGIFQKPLLPEGEITTFQKHFAYMQNLYYVRLDDFIQSKLMLSEFKKGDDKKGTLFRITVNALQLRRDLEKNNIVTKIGL